MPNLLMGVIFIISVSKCFGASNLTCYQCKRNTEEECGPEDLKPCAPIYDRCAIHLKKDSQYGFSIKRECGLAPCSFNDEMTNKGLGMICDRSKDTYDCSFCCKESGCNKNEANHRAIPHTLVILGVVLVFLINVAKDFIPPYFITDYKIIKK